jgi:hypothetical protein
MVDFAQIMRLLASICVVLETDYTLLYICLFEQVKNENDFVAMLRTIRIHVEQERMKEGPLNRLGESAPRGGKQAFKLENLARYNLTRDDLPNNEGIFQLAFLEAEVYALLDEVLKLWETQKLKGMKKPATARQAFLAKPLRVSSCLNSLPSLPSLQQEVLLRGLISGELCLQDMLVEIHIWKVKMRGGW